ncbi:late control protein D [Fusobacterium sp. DD45]|nr:late control protein D [Fusobacterium sp. DD45]MBR8701164.1 hypothetical protein [Fusobacterium sp. DD45]
MNSWNPLKGDKLKVNVYLFNWEIEDRVINIPVGTFYIDKVSYSGIPDIVSISALSVNVTTNIMDDKKNHVWESVSFKKIVEDIAKQSKLDLIYDCKFERNYIRVEQKLESNFNFLKRLGEEIGVVIKLYNNKLIVFEETVYEKKESKLLITRDDIENYNLEIDDTDTYAGCKITYTDSSGKKMEATFFSKQRSGYKRNTKRVLLINEDKAIPGKDKSKVREYLGKIAEKALRNKNKNSIRANIQMIGKEKVLSVGDCIELLSFGIFNGKYMITKISTDLTTYNLNLELQRVEESDNDDRN